MAEHRDPKAVHLSLCCASLLPSETFLSASASSSSSSSSSSHDYLGSVNAFGSLLWQDCMCASPDIVIVWFCCAVFWLRWWRTLSSAWLKPLGCRGIRVYGRWARVSEGLGGWKLGVLARRSRKCLYCEFWVVDLEEGSCNRLVGVCIWEPNSERVHFVKHGCEKEVGESVEVCWGCPVESTAGRETCSENFQGCGISRSPRSQFPVCHEHHEGFQIPLHLLLSYVAGCIV